MAITSKEQMRRFKAGGWRPVVPGDTRFWARADYVVDVSGPKILHRNHLPLPVSLALEVASILGLIPTIPVEGVVVPREHAEHARTLCLLRAEHCEKDGYYEDAASWRRTAAALSTTTKEQEAK